MNYFENYLVKNSNIHGKGIFAKRNINKNKIIEKAIEVLVIIPIITPYFGSLINHSYKPNCRLKIRKDGNYYVIANKYININEELTINYNNTPWFIMDAESHYI